MSAIIFDFDCTIVDSRDYFVDFIAKEADRFPLSEEERDDLKGLPLMKIARRLGIVWWRLPGLYFQGRQEMDAVVHKLKPFAGMVSVIEKLHNEGHELFIVSSNSVKNIRTFLAKQKLREYFVEIYGGVELFGKASMLHRLLRENNLKVNQAVSIGDEVRDIEAAQSVGMRCLAVTWGLSSSKDLRDLKPTAVADSPKDIISILEEI